jgi:1-acyl-sn-glycerol-3-phosphate acyltransferase
MNTELLENIPPRRKVVRSVLRHLIGLVFSSLTDWEIIGQENLPSEGPLLVVANHFNFLDPLAVIHAMPWQLEFIGGFRMPNAPAVVTWIPSLWGVLPVYRGSVSRQTLLASRQILKRRGRLGIFPEAGSWASVLRPARPGAAFLASSTEARLLPVGLDGLVDVFPRLRHGKRARVQVRVGKPFGPLFVSERGETDRRRLNEIGNEIMRKIAELIPPERRGFYSEDPIVRKAAQGTEIYPWDGMQEQ